MTDAEALRMLCSLAGARFGARACLPAAVEHGNDEPVHDIDGVMRRSCGDGARHERERVRERETAAATSITYMAHHFGGSGSMPHLPMLLCDDGASSGAQALPRRSRTARP